MGVRDLCHTITLPKHVLAVGAAPITMPAASAVAWIIPITLLGTHTCRSDVLHRSPKILKPTTPVTPVGVT